MYFIDCDANDPNTLYYVTKSTGELSQKSFKSEEELGKYIFENFNFKNYFIGKLRSIIYGFNSDYYNMENLDEEEISKRKKYCLGIFDLANIMFSEKHMSIDVIHVLMVKLLHLNDTFDIVYNMEYEILFNIVKYMSSCNNFNNVYPTYYVFYKEFINYINQILKHNSLSKRIDFFLNEIIGMLQKMCGDTSSLTSVNSSSSLSSIGNDNMNHADIVKNHIKNNNYRTPKEIILKLTGDAKSNVINSVLLYTIEQKNISTDIIKFLNDLGINKDIEREVYIICRNIDDIMLDIPNANDKCIKLINELNIQKRQNIILMLSDICSDNSDDE
jgi:hypothetical protein